MKLGRDFGSATPPSKQLDDDEDEFGGASAPSEKAVDDQAAAIKTEEGDEEASAPNVDAMFVEADCVVCLERASCVVLLPCGHVCACIVCAAQLETCPMCRSDVLSKISLGSYYLTTLVE